MLALAASVLIAPFVALPLFLIGVDEQTVMTWLIPLAPLITGIVALVVAATSRGGSVRTLFGDGAVRAAHLLIALGVGVVSFIVFNMGFGALLSVLLQLLGLDPPELQPSLRDAAGRPEAIGILILSTSVVAPLGEELLYRGLLFQALLSRFSARAAILLSAGAFGVGHLTFGAPWLSNVTLMILIIPLGAVLAWAFLRWRTLWVPIVIHAVFNAITVLLMAGGFF